MNRQHAKEEIRRRTDREACIWYITMWKVDSNLLSRFFVMLAAVHFVLVILASVSSFFIGLAVAAVHLVLPDLRLCTSQVLASFSHLQQSFDQASRHQR